MVLMYCFGASKTVHIWPRPRPRAPILLLPTLLKLSVSCPCPVPCRLTPLRGRLANVDLDCSATSGTYIFPTPMRAPASPTVKRVMYASVDQQSGCRCSSSRAFRGRAVSRESVSNSLSDVGVPGRTHVETGTGCLLVNEPGK